MGSEWSWGIINDLVDFQPKRQIKKGTNAQFVSMADIPEHKKYIAQFGDRDYKGGGSRFRNGDTLFARITPCLENGKTALVAGLDQSSVAHGSTEFIVMAPRFPEDDKDFVYYLARLPEFRRFAESRMEGTSGRQRVAWQSLLSYEIKYPTGSERSRIGDFLSKLDDKIEINRKMSETLEGMAQALFKSWFVDFDPVIDNALEAGNSIPDELTKRAEIRRKAIADSTTNREIAKQFPDSFQLTEEMGWIPEGWELNSIYEAVEIIYGFPFKSNLFNSDGIGMPIIRIRDLKTGAPQNWSTENNPKAILIRTGDIVTGMDAEFRATLWTGENCYLNQRLFLAKPRKSFNKLFIKYSISPQLEFEENTQVGTTVSHLGKKEIDKFLVLIPSEHISNNFNLSADPILDRLISIHKNTRELKKLRDTLLPKLISGENRIPDAEKLVEDAL